MAKLMQESKTRQELFDNTINHFNSSNRAIAEDENGFIGCKYRTKDGRACAIGREIPTTLARKFDKTDDTAVDNDYIFDKLPQRLQDMGQYFLLEMQALHDNGDNWNVDGLTEYGLTVAKEIASRHDLNTDVLTK